MVLRRWISGLLVLFAVFPALAEAQTSFADRTHDLGFSVGWVFEGSAYFATPDRYTAHTAGLLGRVFYDSFIVEKLAFGVYGQVALTDFPRYTTDSGATLFEAGFSVKPRFFVGEKMAVKPGLNIGYRIYDAADEFVASDGMGLNLGLELQYDMGAEVLPFGEIGFISQPWGGNDETDITYDPILYLQVGIVL